MLASFRNSKNSNSQLLASLKLDSQIPHSPQPKFELAQLSRTPARRIRYISELDIEIEIVEPPRKATVNKDLRVRALREHWDERSKEPWRESLCCCTDQFYSPLRFELSKLRT